MDSQHSRRLKSYVVQIFLLLLPYFVLQINVNFSLYPPPVVLLPLHLLLATGIYNAWKRQFPLWNYTWIGTWYFFLYREFLQIVLVYAHDMEHIFYWGINPLGFAIVLTLISRRDWLFACLTAYPYTSIIQALYTLDRNPVLLIITSLVLYAVFFLPVLTGKSHSFKFLSLLFGTIVIGIGFHVYTGAGFYTLLRYAIILLSIILYPWLIYQIKILRRLLGIQTVETIIA